MRKLKAISVILLTTGVLLLITYIVFSYLNPKASGIYIETNPGSNVFINGEDKGGTPYKENLPVGEVVVRLVPQTEDVPLEIYETKVSLIPGVETVIRRDFAPDQEQASGEIISFEKIDKTETSMSVVTIPDSAQILIDGKDRAYAPFKTNKITPGEHTLVISARGFSDRVIKVKTHKGYNLTLIVDLAVSIIEEEIEVLDEEVDQNVNQVEVSPTGTGFLRVRSEPGSGGLELGRVSPGEIYDLLETDEATGWYRIEYDVGKFGWISNEFATIVNDNDENSE